MTESVSAFLQRAFPQGTIPLPRRDSGDPTAKMHYAFNLCGWESGNESGLLVPERRIRPWPIWPPDMFAAVATLLEQSAAYLQMVYRGAGSSELPGLNSFDAEKVIAATVANGNLSFPNKVLKVCRIVGALWREGCLFISGAGGHKKIEGNAELSVDIISALRQRCFDALAELEVGFHREFEEGEVDRLCGNAIRAFQASWFEPADGTNPQNWPEDSPPPSADLGSGPNKRIPIASSV